MRLVHRDLRHEVLRRCPAGHPLVLRCRPAFREKGRLVPFPTLFWLACDELHRRIARLEAAGGVDRYRRLVAADPALRRELERATSAYVAERTALLTPEETAELAGSGRLEALTRRGIGGVRDPGQIKCLHLHAAHHLARENPVGARVLEEVDWRPCAGLGPARPGAGA